jgi:hypothetical protein
MAGSKPRVFRMFSLLEEFPNIIFNAKFVNFEATCE